MSAARKTVRNTAPTFRTSEYVDVDIDIDPSELEAAWWVYVGTDGGPTTETVMDVVQAWHADTHPTNWRWCPEEPCHSLNREGQSSS